MKRKHLAIIYLLLLSIGTIFSLYMPKTEIKANNMVMIPNDAIRLRILANSDSEEDQEIKRMVRDAVNAEITTWVAELTSKEEARKVIQAGLPEIERIANKVVAGQQSDQEVKVEFGEVEFPTKLYGEFLYPAGTYEAVLITLGEGKGANWWCVLFPPLCFLDFSNGVAVSEGFDEGETDGKKVSAAGFDEEVEKDEADVEAEEEIEADEEEEMTNEREAAPEEKAEEEQNEEKEEVQESVFAVENEEVEVRFFIKELWNKIFG